MSNKEERKAPVLRFKGFTDDWEQRKLKELAIFNPKDNLPEEFEYVDLESVIGTEMLSHKKTALSDAPSRAQRLAKKGDIFYQTVRPYQKNDYLFDKDAENYVFSTGYAQIRPKINGNFLFQLLRTERFVKKVLNECTGTSYPAINSKDLSNIKVSYTNYKEEQRSIGSLLDNLDNLVALQQRKLNELKEVKKTLLSQLFPSKGQYRPIIRFKKFTNKWTKRKLGNIAKIIGGGTPSTSNHDYWNGNINWYSPTEIGNNIFVNSSNKKISIKGLNNSSAKLLPGGKTILFTSRAGIGNMAIMLTDGCTNQGFQSWVIDDTKIDIYFLYSLGRLLKHDAIRQASGSTFLEISNKEVKKLLLEIPSFTEQKLIGNMLRKIDDDIVRQKERIILITKIKKNLLQKLFV